MDSRTVLKKEIAQCFLISMKTKRKLLKSIEAVVKLISSTTTLKGLKKFLATINIVRNDFHGKKNYGIHS